MKDLREEQKRERTEERKEVRREIQDQLKLSALETDLRKSEKPVARTAALVVEEEETHVPLPGPLKTAVEKAAKVTNAYLVNRLMVEKQHVKGQAEGPHEGLRPLELPGGTISGEEMGIRLSTRHIQPLIRAEAPTSIGLAKLARIGGRRFEAGEKARLQGEGYGENEAAED